MDIFFDLRYAFRALRNSRAFFLMAVITLALGLMAVSLMFSVVNAVILQKLPFPAPERIVTITQTIPGFAAGPSVCNLSEYQRWRASGLFQQIAAVGTAEAKLSGAEHAEIISGASVTPDFFRVFGIRPVLGRDFRPDDASAGHHDG